MLINAYVLHVINTVNYYKGLVKGFFVLGFIYDVACFIPRQFTLSAWPLGAAWWSSPAAAPEWSSTEEEDPVVQQMKWTSAQLKSSSLASQLPCNRRSRLHPWQASFPATAEEEFIPVSKVHLQQLKRISSLASRLQHHQQVYYKSDFTASAKD